VVAGDATAVTDADAAAAAAAAIQKAIDDDAAKIQVILSALPKEVGERDLAKLEPQLNDLIKISKLVAGGANVDLDGLNLELKRDARDALCLQ